MVQLDCAVNLKSAATACDTRATPRDRSRLRDPRFVRIADSSPTPRNVIAPCVALWLHDVRLHESQTNHRSRQMHDIDRTQRELEMEAEAEQAEHGEHELEGESFLGSLFGEAEHEHEHAEHGEHEHAEQEGEYELEAESPLSETQEMELASELLEVSSEAELEYFFGKLFSKIGSGIKSFANSSVGKKVLGAVKSVAKQALPTLGSVAGGFLGGPMGAKIGGKLGSVASNLFELELEGLSHEDREFEVARQVVRLGAAAAHRAAQLPRRLPPVVAARRALTSAARVYAPGLLRRGCVNCGHAHARRGVGYRARRPRYGAPGYVRRVNGGTRVIGGEPVAIGGVAPGMIGEPDGDPAIAGGAIGSARGGRWFRRGRHIVLTGL
jgi:hypothetical protein